MGAKRLVQVFLLLALIAAAVRVLIIYTGRHQSSPTKEQKAANAPLNPDYYVTPKKLHALRSENGQDLSKQPVWVRAGYHYAYFPYDGHTDTQA